MQRARVFDTAFSGGYARRVTLTYAFEDGRAAHGGEHPPHLGHHASWQRLQPGCRSLYALGGLDAARMDGGGQICVFAQSETAAYAVLCRRGMRRSSPACSGRQP